MSTSGPRDFSSWLDWNWQEYLLQEWWWDAKAFLETQLPQGAMFFLRHRNLPKQAEFVIFKQMISW